MDVVTAFLNGVLDDAEVYMEQPEGYETDGDLICQLLKALYGLKQAPRVWHRTINAFLISIGFQRSQYDGNLYILRSSVNNDIVYLLLYVDDMLIFTSSRSACDWVKQQLNAKYKMKDLGVAKVFIGIEIERDRANKTITLKQTRYVEKMLKELGMENCNGISTPLDMNVKLWPKTAILEQDSKHKNWQETEADIKQYLSIVGKLMYAMSCTRPDRAYTASLLSRFNSAPMASHASAAKRAIRYLRQTSNYGLHFDGKINGVPTGFSDSDFAGDLQYARSTTGYVFTLNGAAISWKSRRQQTTATATEEAEYMALADAASEATWLRGLYAEIRGIQSPQPIQYCFESTIQVLKHAQSTQSITAD